MFIRPPKKTVGTILTSFAYCIVTDCCRRTRSQSWRRFFARFTRVISTHCRWRAWLIATGTCSACITTTAPTTCDVYDVTTWRRSRASNTRCYTAAGGSASVRRSASKSATDCCGATSTAPATSTSTRDNSLNCIASAALTFAARSLTSSVVADLPLRTCRIISFLFHLCI